MVKVSLLLSTHIFTFFSSHKCLSNSEDLEHLLKLPKLTAKETLPSQHINLTKSNATLVSNNLRNGYSFCETDSDVINIENISESWYQPNLPRESVQNYLLNQEIGSFVIRLSSSCKDCYALSIRVPYFANPNGIAHYLITKDQRGYKLKGVEKEFKSLRSLVTHYSVMQEILPVTLNISMNYSLNLDSPLTINCNSKLVNSTNFNCLEK